MTDEQMPDTEPESKYQWAEDLGEQKAWVLHTPSRAVSRVKAFYDGVARVMVSEINRLPVKGPVVELEDGNTFVAEQRCFVAMEPREVDYYQAAQKTVGLAAKAAAENAAARGIPKTTALMLLGVALRATARVTDVVSAAPSTMPRGS